MVGPQGPSWGEVGILKHPIDLFPFHSRILGGDSLGSGKWMFVCAPGLCLCACLCFITVLLVDRALCVFVRNPPPHSPRPPVVFVVELNWIQRKVGYSFSFGVLSNAQDHRRAVKERCKLQALVCDILAPSIAILDHAVV